MDTAAVRTPTPVRTAAVTPFLARSRWSTALAALAGAISLAAAVVLTAGDGWGLPPAQELVVDLAVGLTYAPIGAIILLARDLGRGTRQLAWVLLGSGVAAAANSLVTATVAVAAEATTVISLLAQLQSWLWVPGFLPLLTLVPLLYPDGLLAGRMWRWAAVASLAGVGLMAAGVALYPEPVEGRVTVTKPLTSLPAAQVLYVAAVALLVPAALLAVSSLVVRMRATTGLQRRQVVVLVVAAGLLLVVTAAQGVIPAPANTLVQACAAALVPLAIAVAVTRHRLYELDVAICRSLVATSLGVCLAATYLTVFALVSAAAPEASLIGTAVAAGLTGVLVQPLARRLTSGVERLYYGDRAEPYAVSARLASRLTEVGLDVAEVPQAVCDTVVESLRLSAARVELAGSGRVVGEAVLDHAPPLADAAVAGFPLRHRGEEVGTLLVTARPGEAAVDLRDAEILGTVADQAAPAIAALQLHEQLQASREALVLAREEERLRLRRDLHDGVGATLAGLRLQVESAQALVRSQARDDRVTTLLEAAGRGVTSAVAEVRGITDSLRPPAVDEIGLGPALTLLAERIRTPGLQVSAHVDPAVGTAVTLSAAGEVAAYRIASEALANVVRHSGATAAVLSLSVEDGTAGAGSRLVLEVVDNGRGLPPSGAGSTSGSRLGLAAMRQRAEEIGGTFEVSPADHARRDLPVGHGTVVRVVLPVEPSTRSEEAS